MRGQRCSQGGVGPSGGERADNVSESKQIGSSLGLSSLAAPLRRHPGFLTISLLGIQLPQACSEGSVGPTAVHSSAPLPHAFTLPGPHQRWIVAQLVKGLVLSPCRGAELLRADSSRTEPSLWLAAKERALLRDLLLKCRGPLAGGKATALEIKIQEPKEE